jgi:hypothetical protein
MKNAPGCFAAASVFAHDSEICKACHAYVDCSKESLKTLEAIKGLVNVSDLLKRHDAARRATRKPSEPKVEDGGDKASAPISEPVERNTPVERVTYQVSQEYEAVLSGMKIKPAEEARKLCNQGLIDKIKEELLAGRNALSNSRPRFVSVALDGLLAGGFDKRELKELFLSKTSMGDSAAASHVSIVLPILFGFGIAQENSGRIILSPKLVA